MIFYILNSLTFKLVFLTSIAISILNFLTIEYLEDKYRIFASSFLSTAVIVGFADSFLLNVTLNDLMILSSYFLVLSLFFSSLSLTIFSKLKIHNLNYILPICAIILPLKLHNIHYMLLSNIVFTVSLTVILLVSMILIRNTILKKMVSPMLIILSGIFLVTFYDLREFLFVGNTIFLVAQIFILKETSEHIKTMHNTQKIEIDNLKSDFEYEVKKHAQERTFFMEIQKENIVKKTRMDNLTGVQNKAGLVHEFSNLIGKNKKFSVLMFDIDNFKGINDTLGHIVGDKCLKNLALIASNSVRKTDIVGRYGGDEFVIILPQTGVSDAFKIGTSLLKRVQKTKEPSITISIGVAGYPWDGETMEALIEVADKGLYASKNKGKNSISYSGTLSITE